MTDSEFLSALYAGVLFRPADAGGLATWGAALQAGMTRDAVRASFLQSAEATQIVQPLVRLYENLLGRAPDAGGLQMWVGLLRNGTMSLTDIATRFLASPEGRADGWFSPTATSTQLVESLYHAMGRSDAQLSIDHVSVVNWAQLVDRGTLSPAALVVAIDESAENRLTSNGFVQGYLALRANSIDAPSTAQLHSFLNTASSADYVASAATVTDGTTLPGGPAAYPVSPPPPPPPPPPVASGTAADLLTNIASITPGTNVTLIGNVTLAQLAAIDAANGNGTLSFSSVADSSAAVSANIGYIQSGTAVTLTDRPTLTQLAAIDVANGAAAVTYTSLSGGAAELAADAATHGGAGTYVKAGLNVDVETSFTAPASIAQLAAIDAANGSGTVSYLYIADTAANLVADSGTYVHGTALVTITDAATFAQIMTLSSTYHGFSLTYMSVADTAANISSNIATFGSPIVSGVDITVTTTATLAQLALYDSGNGASSLTYAGVTDTASSLAADAALNSGAGKYVHANTNVTVTGSATLNQLAKIDLANGTGTLSYGTVTFDVGATADRITGFVSGPNSFDDNQPLANGTASSDATHPISATLSATSFVTGLAAAGAANTLVFIQQANLSGNSGETELGTLAGSAYSGAAATALIAKLVGVGGALNGTLANLDSVLAPADTVLLVLDTGTDSVILQISNTDTTVANTLIAAELQIVGVLAGTAQMAAADFI